MVTFEFDKNGAITKTHGTPQRTLAAMTEADLLGLLTLVRREWNNLEETTPRYPRYHRSKCTNPNFFAAKNAYRAEIVRINSELRQRNERSFALCATAGVAQ